MPVLLVAVDLIERIEVVLRDSSESGQQQHRTYVDARATQAMLMNLGCGPNRRAILSTPRMI